MPLRGLPGGLRAPPDGAFEAAVARSFSAVSALRSTAGFGPPLASDSR